MSINCENLKKHIENAFSMPFVVTSTKMDGESIYMCHPDNEGEVFFDSTVYIRNKIRIIVEIRPQRHGGELLYEISKASTDQRKKVLRLSPHVRGKACKDTVSSQWFQFKDD